MLRCVFLDRDGVLTPDAGGLPKTGDLELIPGIIAPLNALHQNDFACVIVTNQPQVARGLATEAEVRTTNQKLIANIMSAGGPEILSAEFCPHHPDADLPEFRVKCECRKPEPGMLVSAARKQGVSLEHSFMVGDRMTDVAAGAAAGCKTLLLANNEHTNVQIVSDLDPHLIPTPDHTCQTLGEAVDWIISSARKA